MVHYQGSCHCGAVRFSFDAEPIEAGLRCNCSLCQRRGAIMSPFVVPHDALHIKADEGALSCYQFGSNVAKHYFCRVCGIYPFHDTLRTPGFYRVNLNCVEGVVLSELRLDLFDGRAL